MTFADHIKANWWLYLIVLVLVAAAVAVAVILTQPTTDSANSSSSSGSSASANTGSSGSSGGSSASANTGSSGSSGGSSASGNTGSSGSSKGTSASANTGSSSGSSKGSSASANTGSSKGSSASANTGSETDFVRPTPIGGKCYQKGARLKYWYPSGKICYQMCLSNSQVRDQQGRCLCMSDSQCQKGLKCKDGSCQGAIRWSEPPKTLTPEEETQQKACNSADNTCPGMSAGLFCNTVDAPKWPNCSSCPFPKKSTYDAKGWTGCTDS